VSRFTDCLAVFTELEICYSLLNIGSPSYLLMCSVDLYNFILYVDTTVLLI